MPDLALTSFRAPPGSLLRILVVENDPSYAAFLDQLIAASTIAGAHIERADRLADILPRLEQTPIDAILLDLTLPDGDVLAWLRTNAASLRVAVIILTAHDGEHVAVEALAAGAQDFLVKSLLKPEDLTRTVRYSLERKRNDETLRQREEQLRQAQKMEAVGRLAGGIAHDFSNLLTVIIGATERIFDVLGKDDSLSTEVHTIHASCERAAGLTRQLLAFSRMQVLAPRAVDLRSLVSSIGRLLTQLIGEHIFLVIEAPPDLWPVSADPAQLEQVVMNLALNARDAMPEGGSLTLRLQNETVGEGVARDHVPILPGDYTRLEVIDTGEGMDRETVEHAFEPFFTTKDPGKGTGLGLATVYGIVKQSGGHAWIDSVPGRGTTVGVYLPRTASLPQAAIVGVPPTDDELAGHETVLLTEDEGPVRDLIQTVLEANGYTVIPANGLPDAMALAAAHRTTIHVLVTDIVMPGGTGQELARRLRARRPDLKVLFISGYPEYEGPPLLPSSGVAFLAKPFARRMLLRKLREVLD